MDHEPIELLPYPWPFPQWDGARWVTPMELAPKEVRRAPRPTAPDFSDVEEAPF